MIARLQASRRRAWALLRTIRVRLTLWYVGLLALILIAFSAFLYLSLSRSLHAEVDRSLEAAAQQTAAALDVQNGLPSLVEGPDALPTGMVAALYDRTGQQVLANDPRQPLPQLSAALVRAVQGQRTFDTIRLGAGDDWRVLTLPVLDNGQTIALLQVARSEAEAELALQQLILFVAVAIPAILVLAITGGLFLAGRALGPIDRMTRAAGQIGAEDLSRRLQFRGVDDEVGRLAATFDGMLDRLEGAFRRQRQFTADASHELRTPLAMLRSQIDVTLARRRSASEYTRVMASLRDDTDRMSQLLSELLLLARADAGQEPLVRERVDLQDLTEQVVTAMQPLAAQRGVDLRGADGSTAVPVLGDQTRLMQLAINLVDNALKYTPSEGMVTVSVGQAGNWGLLRVADTGIGIALEHLPHLFERFYRVDKARARSEGGVGLGLAICRWIAEAHGGTVAVDSQTGHGTTFTVRLPLAGNSLPPSAPAAGPARRPLETISRRGVPVGLSPKGEPLPR